MLARFIKKRTVVAKIISIMQINNKKVFNNDLKLSKLEVS